MIYCRCSGSYFYYITSCFGASSAVFLSCAVVALFLAKNSNYLLTSRKISAILLLQRSGRLCECRFLYDVDTPLIMCFHRPSKTLILPVTSGSLPFAAAVFYPPYGSRFLFLTRCELCDILIIALSSQLSVGRGTSEPKRSGTSHKTSNGNGGRTENPRI